MTMQPTRTIPERTRGARVATRTVRIAGNVVFAVSVVVAVILLGGPLLARAAGLEVMVVTSGSMSPGIRPADAVILESIDADAIHPGDVITFATRDATHLFTHRVLKVVDIDGETWFQTKGDANEEPDVDLAAATATRGRVRSVVPRVGPWLLLASSRWGPVILLGVPAIVLALQQAVALRRRAVSRSPRWSEAPA
jgi:signal peptidase